MGKGRSQGRPTLFPGPFLSARPRPGARDGASGARPSLRPLALRAGSPRGRLGGRPSLARTSFTSRSPTDRGNEPPSARPPRHCVHAGCGRVSAVRWRVTARRCDPASHLLPAPGPAAAPVCPRPPRGGVSAGAALGKEAVERPAAARGGAINLEQMRPDSRSAWGFGGGLFQSAAELGGLQVEVTRDFGHTDSVCHLSHPRLCPPCFVCPRTGRCLNALVTFPLKKKNRFLQRSLDSLPPGPELALFGTS